MDMLPARTPEQKAANKGKGGYANVRETVVNDLMPTPMSRDWKGDTAPHERDGVVQTDSVERAIFHSGEVLLPTTRTSMANGPTQKELDAGNPKSRLETVTNWGKFEPAIRRWEETLGRPAPSPTKPDGKDGNHRLSSAFTEWMMGLPSGWITEVGLSRKDELKACGNGVVPQQAELALRALLEGVSITSVQNTSSLPTPTTMDAKASNTKEVVAKFLDQGKQTCLSYEITNLESGGGRITMLPTPTVSDTFTDNLSSTQQKEGSMHSVTLPQAVRMVGVRIETGPKLNTPTLQTDNQTIGRDKSTAEDRQ